MLNGALESLAAWIAETGTQERLATAKLLAA